MSSNTLAENAWSVLTPVCERFGLDPHGATLLRVRSNVVFKLSAPIVVRIATATDASSRMPSVLTVTRWLAETGFPAVQPADEVSRVPVSWGDSTVTFWRYVPPGEPPATLRELGEVLRRLHDSDLPNTGLRTLTDPLQSIRTAVRRQRGILANREQSWLHTRIERLAGEWALLESRFQPALLHGDPWIDNLWRAEDGSVVLGDWDHVMIGPREWDLIHTYHGRRRFGLVDEDVNDFAQAYGYDLRSWPGYSILMEIRELYAIAIHIRNASDDPFSRDELPRRLNSLMSGGRDVRWYMSDPAK